jgi:surfeit locus 1 family protein
MRLFGIKPLFWPTVITIPMVAVCFALGVWQVQRLQWKTALIAERQARRVAPPLDGLPAAFDPAKDDFRKVRIVGTFRNDQEMFLAARSRRGNPGYDVVTPFSVKGDGVILINRGWIPLQRKEPVTRAPGQIEGETAVIGYLRVPPKQGWFVPDNEPKRNFWFWIDVPAMAQYAGLKAVKPYFLDAGPAENRGGYPLGGVTRFELPNDHLQYAITWFAMTVIGITVYLLYHRRRAKELAESAVKRAA